MPLSVALAAGVGAVARWLLDGAVQRRTGGRLPLGTLAVNVSGSFLLGVVTGLGQHAGLPREAVLVLGVGLAGGYTTLSTWAWEAVDLLEQGRAVAAVVSLAGGAVLGLLAAAAGLAVALL